MTTPWQVLLMPGKVVAAIFRSFLQVTACQTFLKINFQPGVNLSPVLTVSGSFFRDVHRCQIQHFQQTAISFLISLYDTNFVEFRIWRMMHCCISVFENAYIFTKVISPSAFLPIKRFDHLTRKWHRQSDPSPSPCRLSASSPHG